MGNSNFMTDSNLIVPAISLALRERLETAMLRHGFSRSAPIAMHWSKLCLFGSTLVRIRSFKASIWPLIGQDYVTRLFIC